MDPKKLAKAFLFPHVAILIVLLPTATVLLVYSMVFVGTESIPSYISYALAAYTLTVWCFRVPRIIKALKRFRNENRYALIWKSDVKLRVTVSLYASLLINVAYALLHLGFGFYHGTFWFISLSCYYMLLAIMRFFLLRYTGKKVPGENIVKELKRFRSCGFILLGITLALALMIFFMVYWNRSFEHHEITTIAMAAYTFTALTLAIVNTVKYRKYNSPVLSAAKAISLAAACVSVLTLESAMLTAFGESQDMLFRRLMLGLTGACVSAFIIVMAIGMIVAANSRLKGIKESGNG